MWKGWPRLLRTRLTPRKIWMVSPSRIVRFGVWVVIGSGICNIRVLLKNLRVVNRTLFEHVIQIMAVGATRVDHR